MRLEGKSKAGYYPTPLPVARLIGSCLMTEGTPYLLDPCCGPGTALENVNVYMQGYRRGITHGVELEDERASEAERELNLVLRGDSLKAKVRGSYGLLYLNPPYDQADGTRLELAFLWHWQRTLTPGGVLVYVVPEKYLSEYEATLTAHFEELAVYRFPGEHYDAFKQVVVFGVKRRHTAAPGRLPPVENELTQECCHYVVPESKSPPQLYLTGQDPVALVEEARTRGCWERAWDLLTPPDPRAFQPLMPLRKGHVAQIIASGLLNNIEIKVNGRRLLLRGHVSKDVVAYSERDDKGIKHVERDVIKTEVTALDLDTGELLAVD